MSEQRSKPQHGPSISSSKPLIHADTLRRTLRLIHCLQRERGPSCIPSENHDFLVQSRLDTDHAMMDCHNICLGNDAPIRPVIEKIRAMIDDRRISSHRTLVCYTTLISAVLHEHVLRLTSKASMMPVSKEIKDETPVTKNGFSRIQSHHNFMSITSEDMSRPKAVPRRQRSQSIGLSAFGVETDKPFDPADFVPTSSHAVADSSADATTAGVPIHHATEEEVTSLRLASLSQLLSIFVCIKESTGKERASLYSMLATDHAAGDADFLLGDVVMEVENQRRQLELQHVRNHPLQNLVQELVLMSKDMQQVQNLLSSGCLLDSIKEYYSARQLWDVLTVYMDKLHSLELLIVEEMELALPLVIPDELHEDPVVESSILVDAFGALSPQQLEQAIQAMGPDEVKRRLLQALKVHARPVSVVDEERKDAVATKGVDELMKELVNVPAMKEWEIDVYELKFMKRIGQGAAGTTYLADWSGENVAVKVASITELGLEGWRTEVQALQKLHHPNIIRLLGSVYHQHPLTFCLVLEYCDAGDLASALAKTVPADFFFHVATSVSKGLVYLHSRGLIHRDIKPHNILLNGDLASGHYQVKVTDFGVVADLNNLEDRAAETGTFRYDIASSPNTSSPNISRCAEFRNV